MQTCSSSHGSTCTTVFHLALTPCSSSSRSRTRHPTTCDQTAHIYSRLPSFSRHENAESTVAARCMRITEGVPPLPKLRVSSLLCALKERRFTKLHPAQWSASGAPPIATSPALSIGSFSICFRPRFCSSLLWTLHAYPLRSPACLLPRRGQLPSVAPCPPADDRAAAADVTTLSLCSGIVRVLFGLLPIGIAAAGVGAVCTAAYLFLPLPSS